MTQPAAALLILSLAAALSPTPALVCLLALLSKRGRSAGPSFVGGWMIGLLVAAGIMTRLLAASPDGALSDRDPFFSASLSVLAGALLLLAGILAIRRRPQLAAQRAASPRFARAMDAGPTAAFGVGAGMAALAPKSLILTGATLVVLTGAGIPAWAEVASFLFYVLAATSLIALPVVLYFTKGRDGEAAATRARDWILANQARMLAVSALVLGGLLIIRGLGD